MKEKLELESWRIPFLSFYVGSAFFMVYLLHASAGQYMKELGVNSPYEWTIFEGIQIGILSGLAVGILVFVSTIILLHKIREYQIISAVLNGGLIYAFFLVSSLRTPDWMNFLFVSDISLVALIAGVGTYLLLGLNKPITGNSKDSLKLLHARLLEGLRQQVWLVGFAGISVLGLVFIGPFLQLPAELRNTFASEANMGIHIIGVFYLLFGIFFNMVSPYNTTLKKIEKRVEELDSR